MEELERKLNEPKYNLLTAYKLYRKLKEEEPNSSFTLQQIRDIVDKQETNQITRKPTKAKNFKIVAPPNSFQLDIMFLNDYEYRGYDKILVFIEITSRKAWAYPMKKKKNEEKLEKINEFILDLQKPIYLLEGDNEWNSKEITNLLEKHNIKYSFIISNEEHITKQGNKLGIVDRFVRTLRNLILKYILKNDTLDWVSALPFILKIYNTNPHRSLDWKTPNEVYRNESLQKEIYNQGMEHNRQLQEIQDFDIGDMVRAIKPRGKLEKEKEYFTKKIYTIVEKVGHRYKIKDEYDHILQRPYKFGELLKINEVAIPEGGSSLCLRREVESHNKAMIEPVGQEATFRSGRSAVLAEQQEEIFKPAIEEEIIKNKKQRKKERENKRNDIDLANIIAEARNPSGIRALDARRTRKK